MFSTVDFTAQLPNPEHPDRTHDIDSIQSWHDLYDLINTNAGKQELFIANMYKLVPHTKYTPSGPVTTCVNTMDQEKFKKFMAYFDHIDVAMDFYFLGVKSNTIDAKVKEALASEDNKLWKEGALIVEALLSVLNKKRTFCSMVLPYSNVETSGKKQFQRKLRTLINPAFHHLFPEDLLEEVVRSGERIIHLFKAVQALCNPKYAPNMETPNEIIVKNAKANLADAKLNLPTTATWQDHNLALLREIITTDSDKMSKALGQRVLCDAAIFTDANGADTEEMPINGLNATNLHRAGINAMKQALAYALRCAQDPEFFTFVLFMNKHNMATIESAIHGQFTDTAFGGIGAVRAQCKPHITGTTDKKGKKAKFFNAMGKGAQLINELLSGSLKGTVFDIDLKPTNESGDEANPDFWYKVADIIVCSFLNP